MFAFVIVINIAEISLLVSTSQFRQNLQTWIVSIDWGIINTLLLVIYAFVIIKLISALNNIQMQGSKFAKQKKSVLLQFAFYETSFFGILFLQFIYVIGVKKGFNDFDFALGNIAMHFFCNVAPNLFMIWNHHKLYKKQVKKQDFAALNLSPTSGALKNNKASSASFVSAKTAP